MSIETRSNQYGTIFEHWQIKKLIGRGSGGKSAVFLLSRNDSFQEFCALKVINLIEERGRFEDFSERRKKEYLDALRDCKAQASPEVQMMLDLRGNTNVVDYLDHKFVDWSDASGFGCDLLIRMELLTDLRTIIKTSGESGRYFTEKEIIKIGRDICTALVLCHENGILHRDIKPENILVNKNGDYKLGDFGISRLLDKTPFSMASTGVGTPEYAAPEQFAGKHDTRVDIYSLGLVLYELSNQNRLPFASSSYVRQADIQKRQSGAPFPRPEGISSGLWAVIRKACAYQPNDRYAASREFLSALRALDDTPNAFQSRDKAGPEYETVPGITLKQRATQPNTPVPQERLSYKTVPAEQQAPGNSRLSKPDTEKRKSGKARGAVSRKPTPSGEHRSERREKTRRAAVPLLAAAVLVCLVCLGTMQLLRKDENNTGVSEPQSAEETTAGSTLIAEALDEDKEIDREYLEAEEHCSQLHAAGDHLAAIQYLQERLSASDPDPRLEGLLEESVSLYENNVLQTASAYASEKEYRLAIQTLIQAREGYDCPSFYEAAAQYRQDFGFYNTSLIAAGKYNSIVIDQNRYTKIVGRNDEGELLANNWSDIIAVGMGDKHVIGLKSDGTVVAAGSSTSGRCNVNNWDNVVAICAGDNHTVALFSNGSLDAKGYNEQGQCDVDSLMDAAGDKEIVSIAAGNYHTLALLEDGTVTACGRTSQNACDVQAWDNIAAIFAGSTYSAGLKADGTVVVCGDETANWDTAQWENVVNLSAGDTFLIGLTSEGDFLFAGLGDSYTAEQHKSMYAWQDVIAIASGSNHTIAVTKTGEILSAGVNNYHQGDLDGETIESVRSESGAAESGQVSEVLFDVSMDHNGEFAQIIGVDSEGKPLWSYSTDTYEIMQLSAITEIGLIKNRYYFCEGGTFIALDASTGEVIWKNDEFGGYAPCWLIHDGIFYLSGFLGPDFFAVDQNGKTLCRYEMLDEAYCWPSHLEIEDGMIALYFDLGPDLVDYDSFVFHIDPENYDYAFDRGIPYYS